MPRLVVVKITKCEREADARVPAKARLFFKFFYFFYKQNRNSYPASSLAAHQTAQHVEGAVKKILIASILTIGLAGCGETRTDRTLTGAAIGGVSGAAIGGLATGTGGGAAVGAVIGAAGGAIIGSNYRSNYRRCYINSVGREICRRYRHRM